MVQTSVIPEFPRYYVTNDGRVFNIETEREMVLSTNQTEDVSVGLMRKGTQYRRSVKLLVAQAFVDGWSEEFDTAILLDGNKYNLHQDNIMWRPKWFAWKYAHQFSSDYPGWYYRGPILDITTGDEYDTIYEAAVINGVLCENVRMSILDERLVYPTGQKFIYI